MYGQLPLREMPETVDKDKTWEWTRKRFLKVGTEALILQLKNRRCERIMLSSTSTSQ